MLPRVPEEILIETTVGDYNITNGRIHARVLHGQHFKERLHPARVGLFLHGGSVGGNLTLVERPARWLIVRDLFDQVILPDRRGHGGSSPLTHRMPLREQAEDLQRLLDRMSISGPLTVLGMEEAGPVGLALAEIDPRVQCVVLLASAPTAPPLTGLLGLLQRVGLLSRLRDWGYRRSIGKYSAQLVDYDPAYDVRTPREMTTFFTEALKALPPERAEALEYESEASYDPQAVSVPAHMHLEIPVLQVIGESDEVWGNQLPEAVVKRFPNFKRKVVPGAYLHKEVYFKSEAFFQALCEVLKEACPGVE